MEANLSSESKNEIDGTQIKLNILNDSIDKT